ncbi:MAG: DUF444 family protein [Syntrophobacteraceae bacterium]|nr:DUF444 family protein [Syntrophobacteraceae bacterium]
MEEREIDSPEMKTEEGSRREAQGSDPALVRPRAEDRAFWLGDMVFLQNSAPSLASQVQSLRAIDELLERDKQREADGFPRKIRVGRLVKPGRGGKDKIILVPTTVEEKFLHDIRSAENEKESTSGGTGEGEEGEVIGEEPAEGGAQGEGQGSGPGGGEGADHEIESSAYDLGKVLAEKFELPNLKNKGTKRSLTRYTYDLTDRHDRNGQLLDKKATLRKIIETNIALGNIGDSGELDPLRFLVSPQDEVYRILSREKDYESQAMIFFLRDYSGSMAGEPTDAVVTQHVLIYSWLLYQYERQVETRFILHDTTAKEVPDFYTYYNSTVAGGTRVESAYRLVNEMVETGNLARDYNIYVFHGTDGDDWDPEGQSTLPEIRKTLGFANRVGVTIAGSNGVGSSIVERYLGGSGLLEEFPEAIRMDNVGEGATEVRLIEGIRKLLS